MMNNTKVTYLKNDTVKLVMSMDDYGTLLQGNIDLKSAVEMMGECHTIYLEDLGKLDTLEFRWLGFLALDVREAPLLAEMVDIIMVIMSLVIMYMQRRMTNV